MKILRLSTILILSLFISGISHSANQQIAQKKTLPLAGTPNIVMKSPENSRYYPDRVILKLRSTPTSLGKGKTFGASKIDNFVQRYSPVAVNRMFPEKLVSAQGGEMDMSRFYVLKYSSPIDAFKVAEEISQLPEVEYAEPWFIYSIDDITACSVNDPSRSVQWGLTKILADSAWCVSQGDTSVVIGIVDTGVQWDHPDLSANIWINPGEYGPDGLGGLKQSNGIDDDGDGKIDDWHGWDFGGADMNITNPIGDNNPSPTGAITQGEHGTHVAGIASAVTNNSIGVAGIGYKCKILPVKVTYDNDPNQYINFGFQGILYAAMLGAKVINCSWSGSGYSQFEQEMIDSAVARGALVVAAAGNSYDSRINYPASYRGVISVAATTVNDYKSSYSTYNEFVDVAAPGDNIYSTIPVGSYVYMSGTSMASPLVAGLAALVKSKFPSYTPMQVGEQVRVSCDDISALNPSYVGLIGKGRINAYNALTISLPSLRVTSFLIKDSIGGNNNGILEANETFTITTNFTNYLQPTSSAAMVTLSTLDTNVAIINNSFPIGIVGTLGTANNSGSPFQARVSSDPIPGHIVKLKLTINDGSYTDVQYISILVNPTFATHNVNNVEVTLTNIGRIGYLDISNAYGSGFVYGGMNQLYEGGLVVGYSPVKLVSVVRNQYGNQQDNDFSSRQIYNLSTPGSISSQDGSTMFSDSAALLTNRIGLNIHMHSFAFTSSADSNYVILVYDMKNISGADISNLYVGLFADWDIFGSQADYFNYNRTAFDTSRGLGYAWNSGDVTSIYCGMSVLEGTAGYTGLLRDSAIFTRAGKWDWLSGGIKVTNLQNDVHCVVSAGPYTIANGVSQKVPFALIGGRNLSHLKTNADAAKAKWNAIKSSLGISDRGVYLPAVYSLKQNYPNPFNPVTNIEYELPASSKVILKVYDILGREVASLVNGEQFAGRYSVQFNASQLSSGIYYYQLIAGDFTSVKKLMLIK